LGVKTLSGGNRRWFIPENPGGACCLSGNDPQMEKTVGCRTAPMTAEAVLASQAAICVAQFAQDPNHEEKLKEFSELDSWKRSEFLEKGGWDKMPGQKEASYGVARACTDGVELLIKK